MKILLTGGGTGGHFYPIIAIAHELNEIAKENRLLRPDMYYASTTSYNNSLLYDNNISFVGVMSGKIRRQMSVQNIILNFLDLFKIGMGMILAVWKLFVIYPDVVFGKGGYASFPALFAAKLLRIPVIIHESDSLPGKVNRWAGKFAVKIATSYPEASSFFPKEKTAYTGNPIRKEIEGPFTRSNDTYEILHLNPKLKTILILGGSQGAKFINEVVMDALPELVLKYQIIHQTGAKHIKVIKETRDVVLLNNPNKDRYKPFDYLNSFNMRMAAGVTDLVISRAGSTVFEIASWGKASIIIPIPEATSHDQKSNAYSYARTGAAEVIEEHNLVSHVFVSEINRIMDNDEEREKMAQFALAFSRKDAARLIAQEIMVTAIEHK